MTVAVATTSVYCAVCGRELTDETSQNIGIGPCCRSQYGWRRISSLDEAAATTIKTLIHAIAQDSLRGDELRQALFTIYEHGFQDLAKRIGERVARRLTVEVSTTPPPASENVYAQPQTDVLRPLPFQPTPHQEQNALDPVRRLVASKQHGVVFIVGFAGTGKTSCLQFIAHEHGVPIIITPTGKAALRVREATGLDAMTIHRWMYKPVEDPKTGQTVFKRRDSDIPIPRNRMIVVDEASMVGPDLWKDVYTLCFQYGLRLVIIGDGFQLPPVVPPNTPPFSVLTPAFAQELAAAGIPVARGELTEVLRQAEGSPIIRASILLRQGNGWSAVRDLPQVKPNEIWNIALAVHQKGGITVCHRNVTRFQINAGLRSMLGINDEMPQEGEPLVCLRNTYEAGVLNGEVVRFPGWLPQHPPDQYETIKDRYKNVEENARFGGVEFENGVEATLAVEELHGRLQASAKAIQIAGARWARGVNFYAGDDVAPHISANFGYGWTAHKAQGSQWPYVMIVLEPSIRLNEEDGRRWIYTGLTRATEGAAISPSRI
ncbi:MAG TPA: AAA family ATPase [Vicinamibacterales bacterium]|jgi:exodeoxyribonuclease-5|nr:AAA family ATPase [Vicinamibacterales bacterium]